MASYNSFWLLFDGLILRHVAQLVLSAFQRFKDNSLGSTISRVVLESRDTDYLTVKISRTACETSTGIPCLNVRAVEEVQSHLSNVGSILLAHFD